MGEEDQEGQQKQGQTGLDRSASWAVLDYTGLYWSVLGCTRHYWAVLVGNRLYWVVLDCIRRY